MGVNKYIIPYRLNEGVARLEIEPNPLIISEIEESVKKFYLEYCSRDVKIIMSYNKYLDLCVYISSVSLERTKLRLDITHYRDMEIIVVSPQKDFLEVTFADPAKAKRYLKYDRRINED